MTIEQVKEAMRRCPEDSVNAAISFQESRDPALVPQIVLGVIERFVEPEMRPKVAEAKDDTLLFDDLGIDSLIMVEIVMTIEQVLAVSAPDEELIGLRTIGDVKNYLDSKIRGVEFQKGSPALDLAKIAEALPQQPPFLFVTEAKIAPSEAEGSYKISGEEIALQGHFKDEPVFPASLMIEALGQLACLYMIKSDREEFTLARESGKAWFVSADSVRCQRICRPGDKLELKVKLVQTRAPLAIFNGTIEVSGERTARVEGLTLAMGELTSGNKAPNAPQGATTAADATPQATSTGGATEEEVKGA